MVGSNGAGGHEEQESELYQRRRSVFLGLLIGEVCLTSSG